MIADMVGLRNKQVRKGITNFWDGQHVADQTLAAMQEMERYCAVHPGSPAAVRRPGLSIRGRTFVALLGPTIEEGIAGFGERPSGIARLRYAILPLSRMDRCGRPGEQKRTKMVSVFGNFAIRRFRRTR